MDSRIRIFSFVIAALGFSAVFAIGMGGVYASRDSRPLCIDRSEPDEQSVVVECR